MPELKHIQCKLTNTGCTFEIEKGCRDAIEKAYEWDAQGFGEWVGDEMIQRGSRVMEYEIGKLFKESHNYRQAVFKLHDVFGKRLTPEQLWDTLCESANNFIKKYDIK